MDFKSFVEDFNSGKLDFVERKQCLSWDFRDVADFLSVKRWVIEGLSLYVDREVVWLDEYDEVVEWLRCNHGQGLLFHGSCGLGKTLITTKLLPIFFHRAYNKIVEPVDARGLKALFDSGRHRSPILIVDDVGEEGEVNDYGTKHTYFSELMDEVEKRGTLLIVSSNLAKEDFKKYGARAYDRLRSMCHRIDIKGKSLRGRTEADRE